MKKELFGSIGEASVERYTIGNDRLEISVLTLGATLSRLSHEGAELVCGFDSVEDVLTDDSYQGAIIGRVGNRIGGSQFMLDGKLIKLNANDGANHLHGGISGFNRKIWTVESVSDNYITLSYLSPDGEENYPGNLKVLVTYTVDETAVIIDYKATTDKKTAVSLTNHAYFNLNGYNSGSVLTHKIKINASNYTEVDAALIATGRRLPVDGTVFDLRAPIEMGKHIGKDFGGYDNNFIFDELPTESICGRTLPLACEVWGNTRKMSVYTDCEGVQLYIGNALIGEPSFRGGYRKAPHTTFCLETQAEPNSPSFGRALLSPEETYKTATIYKFDKA